jgi:predicted TPR repeat methyltransferase
MERSADIWLADARTHYDAERRTEAAHALERALAIDAKCTDAWFLLGNVRQEQGQHHTAIDCFERVVALNPLHAKAWNNIGVSREAIDNDTGAAQAYQRAIEAAPTLVQAILNLAHLALRRNDGARAGALLERIAALDPPEPQAWEMLDRAIRHARAKPWLDQAETALARGELSTVERCCLAALEHAPGNPTLMHLLAVARGEHSSRPPDGYVAALFDRFAGHYDKRMLDVLEFRVPEKLAQLVMPVIPRNRPARIVDLGCGTGLLGAELAELKAEMTGIDLSQQMLDLAARRGIYIRLLKGDIVEELQRFPASTADAVLASDVFVYVGDLRAVFAAAARTMVPGGIFAFSVEAAENGEFHLGSKGRYMHSAGYLRKLAEQCGLVERWIDRVQLRREGEVHIHGWLACFAKSD